MSASLVVRDVDIRRGVRLVVQGASFSASRGEIVAVTGASGTGKTSVLRGIGGLEPLSGGIIDIEGFRLEPGRLPRGAHLRDLYRRVGMVFQFHHLFAHLSALDNICLAPIHVLHESRDTARARAEALLELLGVGDRGSAMPHELSGGEAQRVAIARALAVEPPVLLMDEPTASLDQARRRDLAATLLTLAGQGRTILIATHDLDFARACATRVVLLDGGRVVREGVPSDVLA